MKIERPTNNGWITTEELKPGNFPAELKERLQWVCWRLKQRDDKMTKPPINAKTGRYAKPTDPSTWSDFDTALTTARQFDGIGYVLTKEDGMVMVDLDNCRDPGTEEIEEWALNIVEKFGSYTEISPSTRGLKILIKANPPGTRNRTTNLPWEHGDKAGIEFYATGRYTTLTGHLLGSHLGVIEQRQEELNAIYDEIYREPSINAHTSAHQPADDAIIAKVCANKDNQRLFDGSIDKYPSQSEADLALCFVITQYTEDPDHIDRVFRRSKLFREKWDELHGSETYGLTTIKKALAHGAAMKRYLPRSRLNLMTVDELERICKTPTEFVVDRLLIAGGSSLLVAKPKVGKSTFALNLAVAVSRGEPFLGLATKKMPVIYLGLDNEAKQSDLSSFFNLHGVNGNDIRVYAGPAAFDLAEELKCYVQDQKPSFIIIDTLGKAIHPRDFNDYAKINEHITPLINLSRSSDSHIMMLHHATKGTAEGDDFDKVLGSQAIRGAVDTVMLLTRKGDGRCLSSEGRFGEESKGLLLSYDPKSRLIACVGDLKQYEKAQLEYQVIRLLQNNPGLTLDELRDKLAVRPETLNALLRELLDCGKIRREGSGKRGDPFRHFVVADNSGFQIDNTEIEETGN